MATNRVSPKKGKVVDIPDAVVTIGTPTAGDAQVSVAFTASSPATGGPVQKYTAISSPGSFTASGSTSPVVVTGLTNGTAYTFTVAAGNATGNGVFSAASASATPIVSTSFESIATTSVGSGGTASISFTSIPQTYKHLQIRYSTLRSVANELALRFNGDTGANYSIHYLTGDGSAASAAGYAMNNSRTYVGNDGTSTQPLVGVIDVLDYTNTNKLKVQRTLSGVDKNGSGSIFLFSGAWNNTSAVTQVDLFPGSGTLTGSFALYGVKG